jgi:hypothetical protein
MMPMQPLLSSIIFNLRTPNRPFCRLDGDIPNTIIEPKSSYFRRFGPDFFSLYA